MSRVCSLINDKQNNVNDAINMQKLVTSEKMQTIIDKS